MRRKKLVTLIGGVCLILVLASLPFMAACPTTTTEKESIVFGQAVSLSGMLA
jgi:hypothetical protein